MSSADLRLLAKAIVRTPSATNFENTNAPSVSMLRRSPFSSSLSGGFLKSTRRSPLDAPSLSTSVNGTPVRTSASSRGLAMVALVRTNLGSAPCSSATRRRRLMTAATCEPKTPRRRCASSTATILRLRKKSAQRESWLGRRATLSMSGFVRITFALFRTSAPRAFGAPLSSGGGGGGGHVEHVGVRGDHVRPFSHFGAQGLWRVPVVGRGVDAAQHELAYL